LFVFFSLSNVKIPCSSSVIILISLVFFIGSVCFLMAKAFNCSDLINVILNLDKLNKLMLAYEISEH